MKTSKNWKLVKYSKIKYFGKVTRIVPRGFILQRCKQNSASFYQELKILKRKGVVIITGLRFFMVVTNRCSESFSVKLYKIIPTRWLNPDLWQWLCHLL